MLRHAIIGMGALVLVLGVSVADEPTGPRWEYRYLTREQVLKLGNQDLVAGLNALGDERWELAGIDGAYIFKRPVPASGVSIESLKRRVTDAETNADLQRERLAWSELMARKGLVSEAFLQAERNRMKAADAAVERTRRDLDARLLPSPKKTPEPTPQK